MSQTTMKRIAGELGVSITTVSKVLNNHDDISPATRARVLAKVEELGYQPNAVARSLTLRRTHTLGIVIPDLMHSFFVEIIAGIERSPARAATACSCAAPAKTRPRSAPSCEMLRGRQVDGIVLGSTGASNAELLLELTRHGLVMIDRDDYPAVAGKLEQQLRVTRAGSRVIGAGESVVCDFGGTTTRTPKTVRATALTSRVLCSRVNRPPSSSSCTRCCRRPRRRRCRRLSSACTAKMLTEKRGGVSRRPGTASTSSTAPAWNRTRGTGGSPTLSVATTRR